MIRYSLRCAADHRFEAWFRNSAAYDEQIASGTIACPTCGSSDVAKALMAPTVSTRTKAPVAQTAPHALAADPRAKALSEAVKRLRRHVVENADYVGEQFPEEARRIHYDETEQRSIYGEASADDVQSLLEEGIEILPLPKLPDDQN